MDGSAGSCVWKPLVLNFVESGCVVHLQRRGVRNDQSSVSDSNAWRDVVRESATYWDALRTDVLSRLGS